MVKKLLLVFEGLEFTPIPCIMLNNGFAMRVVLRYAWSAKVEYYNERDFFQNERLEQLVEAVASIANVDPVDVSAFAYLPDLSLGAPSRTQLLYAGRLPSALSVVACETAGFAAQGDYSDVAMYCAASCSGVGESCVAISVNTTTDECCTYDGFDDTSTVGAGSQDAFDTFFYAHTQAGECFAPSTTVSGQICRRRPDPSGSPHYYSQCVFRFGFFGECRIVFPCHV